MPVSSLSDEIATFLTKSSTLMKRNILLAMISKETSASSEVPLSSMLSLEMMRGDDSILHAAWASVVSDKEFKQGVDKMKRLHASLSCDVNMLLTNPFGAHGFDADTCDRWTFPSSNSLSDAHNLPLRPPVRAIEPACLNERYAKSEAYQQLCANYDNNLSSLVLSFPSAKQQPLHGSAGTLNGLNGGGGGDDVDAPMIHTAVLLGEHASKGLGEYGPCLIATTYDKLAKWTAILEKHAPQLKVLPYWGCSRDRVALHGFIDQSETGSAGSSWHVLLTPIDALLGEVLPHSGIECWQVVVVDELQPLLMSSNLALQRAALLRARTCHGRIILQQGLAPNKGKEIDVVGAVTVT